MVMPNINDMMFANANKETEMGTKIEDGTGSGKEAAVNSSNEMSVTTETPFQRALNRGDAWSWTSVAADIDTGDTMLMVRNDSTVRDLIIEEITVNNGNVAATYDIHIVTAAYTAAGTAVTAVNLNTNYTGNAATATAFGDESGNTQGSVLQEFTAGVAVATYIIPMNVRLKGATALGIDQITESTAGSVQMRGYFVDA